MLITIYGTPVPKARPRMTRSGHVYTPKKTVSYEELVAVTARSFMRGQKPLEGPLFVVITCYMPKPLKPKWPVPAVKPDWDNLAKGLIDACNGIVYKDDSQIVDARVIKLYAEQKKKARVELRVEAYGL